MIDGNRLRIALAGFERRVAESVSADRGADVRGGRTRRFAVRAGEFAAALAAALAAVAAVALFCAATPPQMSGEYDIAASEGAR